MLPLLSGYKAHLALLGWYNERVGVTIESKCITIHGKSEKEVVEQKVAAASLRWA